MEIQMRVWLLAHQQGKKNQDTGVLCSASKFVTSQSTMSGERVPHTNQWRMPQWHSTTPSCTAFPTPIFLAFFLHSCVFFCSFAHILTKTKVELRRRTFSPCSSFKVQFVSSHLRRAWLKVATLQVFTSLFFWHKPCLYNADQMMIWFDLSLLTPWGCADSVASCGTSITQYQLINTH